MQFRTDRAYRASRVDAAGWSEMTTASDGPGPRETGRSVRPFRLLRDGRPLPPMRRHFELVTGLSIS